MPWEGGSEEGEVGRGAQLLGPFLELQGFTGASFCTVVLFTFGCRAGFLLGVLIPACQAWVPQRGMHPDSLVLWQLSLNSRRGAVGTVSEDHSREWPTFNLEGPF